jgi:hypothetical protein
MSSDDADVGFLGARAEPHVATSHPELLLTQSSVATLAWFLCKGSLDARVNAATVLAGT